MRKNRIKSDVFLHYETQRRPAMGPFPHNAPRSKITKGNPAGTDGFAFVEFMDPNPDRLRTVFTNMRSEEHTSELQSRSDLVCRLLLEKKNKTDCQKQHEDKAREIEE